MVPIRQIEKPQRKTEGQNLLSWTMKSELEFSSNDSNYVRSGQFTAILCKCLYGRVGFVFPVGKTLSANLQSYKESAKCISGSEPE